MSHKSHQALLEAGYDPNYMLHPWVRRSYDDERKSALFFAVSNNDVASAKLLLEAGAMANQDPVKCLQVCVCVYVYNVFMCKININNTVDDPLNVALRLHYVWATMS